VPVVLGVPLMTPVLLFSESPVPTSDPDSD